MADVAALGLAVDSSQVTAATGALNQFSASANTAAQSADRISLANGKVGPTTQTVAAMAKSAGISLDEMTKRIQATSSAFDSYANKAKAVQQANAASVKAANDNTGAITGLSKAANDNSSSFDRLANTITRRFIVALVINEIKNFVQYLWNLNAALAATAQTAELAGVSYQKFQGLQTAASYKGVSNDSFNSAMLEFAKQTDLAKQGLGALRTLLVANGQTVGDTATNFGKVADLVANAANGAQKLSILQQAGLPATREFALLMSQGSAAINKQSDAATKLTDQQLEDAKRIDAAWKEGWTNFENYGKKAVVNTFSAISEIWGRGFGPTGKGAMDLAVQQAVQAGQSLITGSQGLKQTGYTPDPYGTTTAKPTVNPEDLKAQIALEQQRIGILGQMATVEQQVRAVELSIQTARLNNVNISKSEADNLKRLTAEQALGTFQIKASTDAENVRSSTLLMTTQAAIAYALVQTKINEAIAKGAPLTDQQISDLKRTAESYAKVKVETDRYEEAIKTAKDSGAQFTNDLVSGLISGKSLMDSLASAATNLGKSLTSTGINNIFKDPTNVFGYVEAGVGVLMQLFGASGDADKALQKAKDDWAKMADQVVAFNNAAAGFNLGPLTQEIQSLFASLTTLSTAAYNAHDFTGLASLQNNFNAGLTRIFAEFAAGTQTLTPLQQAMKDLTDEALGLQQELNSLNLTGMASQVPAALQARMNALITQFQQSFIEKLTGDINTNAGKGYINDISAAVKDLANNLQDAATLGGGVFTLLANVDFASKAQAVVDGAKLTGQAFDDLIIQFPQLNGVVHAFVATMDAATAAAEKANLQMRLLTATTDSSTLTGALTLFDAKAKQEYDAAVAAGSVNLTLLEQAQAAERANIVTDFAQKAIDAEKQLADTRLSQMQRIQQYLDNLTGGSNSSLSPRDRLDAAQSQFTTQLGLAQGGDANALSNITSYSDNLLSAAKDYYASSQGYQQILAAVMSSLGGLAGRSIASGVTDSGLLNTSSSIGGVSSISSIGSTSAANSNSWADVVSAVNAVKAEVAGVRTGLDDVKKSIDIGNANAADIGEQEVEALQDIGTGVTKMAANGGKTSAAPW